MTIGQERDEKNGTRKGHKLDKGETRLGQERDGNGTGEENQTRDGREWDKREVRMIQKRNGIKKDENETRRVR